MNNAQIIAAWKNADVRATLSSTELASLPVNPAGARLVELGESELQNVVGAMVGCGLVCTATWDCADSYFEKMACKIYHNITD